VFEVDVDVVGLEVAATDLPAPLLGVLDATELNEDVDEATVFEIEDDEYALDEGTKPLEALMFRRSYAISFNTFEFEDTEGAADEEI
jgi:hypothetical protein